MIYWSNAEVAQLAEQGFCKAQVAGANPVLGSRVKKFSTISIYAQEHHDYHRIL